jgi:hypothetical protein
MEPLDLALRDIWNPAQHIGEEPDNQNIVKIIEFLNTHPMFIKDHPCEAKSYMEMIEKTDLVQIPDSAWKTYSILHKNHPNLFPKANPNIPMITIKMGKKEITIPKNQCLAQSKKFRKEFRIHMLESQTQTLDLNPENPENYDDASIEAFFSYLANGQDAINEENVWELYLMADEHGVDELKENCAEFLKKSIDTDNWEPIADLSIRTHNLKLAVACFKFALDTEKEKVKKNLEKNPRIIPFLLALAVGKTHFDETVSDGITEENVFLCYTLAEAMGDEKLKNYCDTFIGILEAKKPPDYPNFLFYFKKAIDQNFKKLVWDCLHYSIKQQNCIYQLNLNLQGHPYENIQKISKISYYDITLIPDKPGSIRINHFSEELVNALKSLSSFIDITLDRCSYYHKNDLQEFNSIINQGIPFTVLNINVNSNEKELIPFLEKIPTLRGYYNMANVLNNYDEFIEYTKKFSPINQNSKIHLTGFTLGKGFTQEDIDKVLQLYPNLEHLHLLECNLEELTLPFLPNTDIEIRSCANLKKVEIQDCAGLSLDSNVELSSAKIKNKDWKGKIYESGCNKLEK